MVRLVGAAAIGWFVGPRLAALATVYMAPDPSKPYNLDDNAGISPTVGRAITAVAAYFVLGKVM